MSKHLQRDLDRLQHDILAMAASVEEAVIKAIRLYNAGGNIVRDLSYGEGATGVLTIGVGDLPPGTYYLLIREEKKVETQKIVIYR